MHRIECFVEYFLGDTMDDELMGNMSSTPHCESPIFACGFSCGSPLDDGVGKRRILWKKINQSKKRKTMLVNRAIRKWLLFTSETVIIACSFSLTPMRTSEPFRLDEVLDLKGNGRESHAVCVVCNTQAYNRFAASIMPMAMTMAAYYSTKHIYERILWWFVYLKWASKRGAVDESEWHTIWHNVGEYASRSEATQNHQCIRWRPSNVLTKMLITFMNVLILNSMR